MRRTILCLSSDPPPLPGHPVSGGGLRIGSLAAGLAWHGHRVFHGVDARNLPEDAPEELKRFAFQPGQLLRTVAVASPDVLLVEQWGLVTWLSGVDLPVVIDLHGSLTLENLFRRKELHLGADLSTKIEALQRADHLLVPGQRQKDYFTAFALLSGMDLTRSPISVLPLCLPEEGAERTPGERGLRMVYGGTRWPWIDSRAAIFGAADALSGMRGGELHLYLDHPKASLLTDVDGGTSPWPALDAALPGLSGVKRMEAVSHARYREILTGWATVAFDVYADNPERRLAMTTRTVEYLWAGLPVVYSGHGELAQEIEGAQAGWLVDPEDRRGVATLVRELARKPQVVKARGNHARELFNAVHQSKVATASLAAWMEALPPRTRGPSVLTEIASTRVALVRQELELVRLQAAEREKFTHAEYIAERTQLTDRLTAQIAIAEEEVRDISRERDRALALAEDDLRALRGERDRVTASAEEQARMMESLRLQAEGQFAARYDHVQMRLEEALREREQARELARDLERSGEQQRATLQGQVEEHIQERDHLAEELEARGTELEGLRHRVAGLIGERDGLMEERASLHQRIADIVRERDEALGKAEVFRVHAANVEKALGELRATPPFKLGIRSVRDRWKGIRGEAEVAEEGKREGPLGEESPEREFFPGEAPQGGQRGEPPPRPIPGTQIVQPRQRIRGAAGRLRASAELIRLWSDESLGKL